MSLLHLSNTNQLKKACVFSCSITLSAATAALSLATLYYQNHTIGILSAALFAASLIACAYCAKLFPRPGAAQTSFVVTAQASLLDPNLVATAEDPAINPLLAG